MLEKKAFIGIVAVTFCANAALGAASVRSVGTPGASAVGGATARAGSLRTPTKVASSGATVTSSKTSVSTSDGAGASGRMASSLMGGNNIGNKVNKVTKSSANAGAALAELERRVEELYAVKMNEGDFERKFETQFGAKSAHLVESVAGLDTRMGTAESEIQGIKTNVNTVGDAVLANAKSYADSVSGVALETATNRAVTYSGAALTEAKSFATSEATSKASGALDSAKVYTDSKMTGFATEAFVTSKADTALTNAKEYTNAKFESIEIPDVDLSGYYGKSDVDAKDAETLSTAKSFATSKASTALDAAKTYADGKVSGLATETFATEQANTALNAAQRYVDTSVAGRLCANPTFQVSSVVGGDSGAQRVQVYCDSDKKAEFVIETGAGTGVCGIEMTNTEKTVSGKLGQELNFTNSCTSAVVNTVFIPYGDSGTVGKDGCSADIKVAEKDEDGCVLVTTTPYTLNGSGECVPATSESRKICDGDKGESTCAAKVETVAGTGDKDGCYKIKTTPQKRSGSSCVDDTSGTASETGWICKGEPGVSTCATKLEVSNKTVNGLACKRHRLYNQVLQDGVCVNDELVTSYDICPGAPGTGITYQGDVTDCATLKTQHNGAAQGYAWYVSDVQLLCISDGTATSFDNCPTGCVEWKGEPGQSACAPKVIKEAGTGNYANCVRSNVRQMQLDEDGACTVEGTLETGDWICPPCQGEVTVTTVDSDGNQDANGECQLITVYNAGTRNANTNVCGTGSVKESKMVCNGTPGTSTCATRLDIQDVEVAGLSCERHRLYNQVLQNGACVDDGAAIKDYNVCPGRPGTGIEYQGVEDTCQTLINHHPSAPSGHAWYVTEIKKLCISDGSTNPFSTICPDNCVEWKGDPGLDACAPVVSRIQGTSTDHPGCSHQRIQTQIRNAQGICVDDGTTPTDGAWECTECSDVLVAEKVTAAGVLSETGECSRVRSFAAVRQSSDGTCQTTSTVKSTSAITCPGVTACAPVTSREQGTSNNHPGCFRQSIQKKKMNAAGTACENDGDPDYGNWECPACPEITEVSTQTFDRTSAHNAQENGPCRKLEVFDGDRTAANNYACAKKTGVSAKSTTWVCDGDDASVDLSSYYNKTTVDNLLSDKADKTDLDDYALKSETWTCPGNNIQVVQTATDNGTKYTVNCVQ